MGATHMIGFKIDMPTLLRWRWLFIALIPLTLSCGTTAATPITDGPVQIRTGGLNLAQSGEPFISDLAVLPDSANTRRVAWINDFDATLWTPAQRSGQSRPGADAPAEWFAPFISGITDALRSTQVKGEEIELPPSTAHWPDFCCARRYVGTNQFTPYQDAGFDLRNVDRAITAGEGLEQLQAAFGDFDPARTENALTDCTECEPAQTVVFQGSNFFYSWGPDGAGNLSKRLQPPLYGPVGRSVRLYVGNGLALHAHSDAGIESMMAISIENSPSLAEDPDYQLAARALVGLGAYDAALSEGGRSLADVKDEVCDGANTCPEWDAHLAQVEAADLLEPFSVVAVGYALKDPNSLIGGADVVMALVCPDDETASANVRLLANRLQLSGADVFEARSSGPDFWGNTMRSAQIAADGRVVLVRFEADGSTNVPLDRILARGYGWPSFPSVLVQP